MLAAVTLIVLALACGCAEQQEAAVDHSGELSSEEGQIAFMRARDFDPPNMEADIYITNVDGTGERRLTDSPGLDGFPTWSPDGQRITFVSDRAGDGNWEIYVMDSDGTHQRRLTNTPEQDEALPAWSPDGEQIAYATDFIGDGQLWVMNTDGSNRQQLGSGLFPNWSPDGEQIAYTTYLGKAYLAVMNADGSERRSLGTSVLQRLLSIGGGDEPAWAPDDERIAYVFERSEDNSEIYMMDSDGSELTRLTDIPGHDHWPPTWSPDGTRIAFTSDGTKGIGEIYVMNSDGSGLTKLTDDPAADAFPTWRP
jgi:Tol biopolymer transport system component